MAFQSAYTGHVKVMTTVPMIAGDVASLNCAIAIRQSPLQSVHLVDPVIDILAFDTPIRHLVPEFETFMEQGINETLNWPTLNASEIVDYWGCGGQEGTVPALGHRMVTRIYNEYFVDKTDTGSQPMSDSVLLTDDSERTVGPRAARLPTPISTGVTKLTSDSDREVTVSGGSFDLADMAETHGNFATELSRQWRHPNYRTVIAGFGGKASTDADERPRLLNHVTMNMGGYEIDGTGQGVLGQFTGKSGGMYMFGFPRRFFPEHSLMCVVILVRYPSIYKKILHPVFSQTNPGYGEFSGDPGFVANQVPEDVPTSAWFSDGDSTSMGILPYGARYRYHPDVVSSEFEQQTVHPFLDTPTSHDVARYHQIGEHADIYQNQQNLDFTAVMGANLIVDRVVPDMESSIYAALR